MSHERPDPNQPPKLRGTIPKIPYCDIAEEDIAIAIATDPVLRRYQQQEQDTYAAEEAALAYADEVRTRLNEQHLKIAEAEAVLATLNREKRSIMGELNSAKYKESIALRSRAALLRRWKQRELNIFKALVSKALRSVNKELLPSVRYQRLIDQDE